MASVGQNMGDTADQKNRTKLGMIQCMAFMKKQGLTRSVKRFYWEGLYKLCKGMPALTIYHGIEPWPELWYVRLFDGKKPTGYFAVATSYEAIRGTIPTDKMVRFARNKEDIQTIVETWM